MGACREREVRKSLKFESKQRDGDELTAFHDIAPS